MAEEPILKLDEENIWKTIQENGWEHAILFLSKKETEKGNEKTFNTITFGRGNMDFLYPGVVELFKTNEHAYKFFLDIIEDVRKSKLKADPRIN